MNKALLAAITAFSMWGLFPLYWKVFSDVSSWDLFAFRLVFSLLTLFIFVLVQKKFGIVKAIFLDKKRITWLCVSSFLISFNWLLYIYAVNTNRILEASMGYFLNPILLIILGRLIFKEEMRSTQAPSVILVLIAITYIAFHTDLTHFPWIAISLATSFALYGLIRKIIHVGSVEGLFIETLIVSLPALLAWPFISGNPLTIYSDLGMTKGILICFSGLLTGVPLILFAFAAKKLTLTTLGFTQYLSPSFKFICGIVVFHEVLLPHNLVGFTLIWISLGLYSMESIYFGQKKRLQNRKNL